MAGGGTSAETNEVEWQFDGADLSAVEQWVAALPSRPASDGLPVLSVVARAPRRLVDRYFDTEDWRIRRAGFALRERRRGHGLEATLKALGDAPLAGRDASGGGHDLDSRDASGGGTSPGAPRERVEITQPLPAEGLAALDPEGPVGRRVRTIAGESQLVQMFEIRTRRRPFSIRSGGTEVAELALDETAVFPGAGRPRVQLRRVEVEVVGDRVTSLAPLVEELRTSTGIRPATRTKFEVGLLAAGVPISETPDLGATAVVPGSSAGELAHATLRRHLGELLAREAGTRLGEDIEELHAMRVATRRLRATIGLFAGALPAHAQTLSEELGWLAGALGHVRDLDVHLERMDRMTAWAAPWGSPDALRHLRDLLESERRSARADLLGALGSERWGQLVTALVALSRAEPDPACAAAAVPAVVAMPELVLGRHRAAVKAARRARRSGTAPDFHRLRIRCKRLRYCVESATPLYGGPARRYVRALARLQESLGRIQDAEVASARLYELATGGSTALPAATVFAMGGVAEHYRREAADLRRRSRRRIRLLSGTAWDELGRAMAAARRAPDPGGARQPVGRSSRSGTSAPSR
jgi:CHAD domain-containing protein